MEADLAFLIGGLRTRTRASHLGVNTNSLCAGRCPPRCHGAASCRRGVHSYRSHQSKIQLSPAGTASVRPTHPTNTTAGEDAPPPSAGVHAKTLEFRGQSENRGRVSQAGGVQMSPKAPQMRWRDERIQAEVNARGPGRRSVTADVQTEKTHLEFDSRTSRHSREGLTSNKRQIHGRSESPPWFTGDMETNRRSETEEPTQTIPELNHRRTAKKFTESEADVHGNAEILTSGPGLTGGDGGGERRGEKKRAGASKKLR